jgi:hypothetical protein
MKSKLFFFCPRRELKRRDEELGRELAAMRVLQEAQGKEEE